MVDFNRLLAAYETARADLLAEQEPAGHWTGRLSSSALSTATAVSALAIVQRHAQITRQGRFADEVEEAQLSELIVRGVHWLADAQNEDGGWGDTDQSLSNIATTMLVRAAFRLTCVPASHPGLWERSEAYVRKQGGLAALRRRYGVDKTFVVPILTNCALAGLVSWKEVAPLPFELACLPQSLYRFLQLPVVSYAIPALVAIGQARFFHQRPVNPLTRWIRGKSVEKSLQVLTQMQPASGGFLEATPLTSFVVMSLASIDRAQHPVVQKGVDFLLDSVREDGSWLIDTNLATWNTSLAVNALAADGEPLADKVDLDWLLNCQNRQVHPYTGAPAGGWGWSDLSGSVPDADDTPCAMLALHKLRPELSTADQQRVDEAAAAGADWLLGLQNRDGGWPTFCRGWGKLPFDRSGADLTAHVIRALSAWKDRLAAQGNAPATLAPQIDAAIARGFAYLGRQQRPDGSWIPLWFGNQHHPQEENPVYGTARVLLAYRDCGLLQSEAAQRAAAWLVGQQEADGGWGGPYGELDLAVELPRSSTEETALAVEALLTCATSPESRRSADAGLDWLTEAVETKVYRQTSPIGFYFAKLWYYEKLYPLLFTVSALGRAVNRRQPTDVDSATNQPAHA
ncbi:MAG: prenyltransferase/squalene oxidase repeat-containing protein [Pirellulales bacterium]